MRRFLLLLTSLLLFSLYAEAQQSSFEKGSAVIDFTIGTPTSSKTQYREVIVPPVSLVMDFGGPSGFLGNGGKKKNAKGSKSKGKNSSGGKGALGFGGIASFYADDCWGFEKYHFGNKYARGFYDAEVYNIFLAFRFSFHIEVADNTDLYTGLLMGGRFRIWDYVEGYDYTYYSSSDPVENSFCFGPYIGIRYYFGDVFGVKAEFGVDTGAGMSNAQAGISLKLK